MDYIYIYNKIKYRVEVIFSVYCSGNRGSMNGCVILKSTKWNLMPPCWTLSIIRYGWWVKGAIHGKQVRLPQHFRIVATENGAFGLPLSTVSQLTIYIYIYIYIYMRLCMCVYPLCVWAVTYICIYTQVFIHIYIFSGYWMDWVCVIMF